MGKTIDRKSPEALKARIENEPLYILVGEAITHWSDLEGRLVRIGAKLLGIPADKAGVVFYSIANFYTWIAIIDDLFDFDGSYLKSAARWHKIKSRIKSENDIRVRIAHQGTPVDSPGELRRHHLDARSKSRAGKPLTAAEIQSFIVRVDRLYADLIDLLRMMRHSPSSR